MWLGGTCEHRTPKKCKELESPIEHLFFSFFQSFRLPFCAASIHTFPNYNAPRRDFMTDLELTCVVPRLLQGCKLRVRRAS